MRTYYNTFKSSTHELLNVVHDIIVVLVATYYLSVRGCMFTQTIPPIWRRPWYVQPCLCDWVIKGLGMSSHVCVTG